MENINYLVMELAILVSKIMSLFFFSTAIGAMNNRSNPEGVFENFYQSPALRYLGGFITLILGMIILEYHSLWIKSWRLLITLFGWLALIKGIAVIAFPQSILLFRPIFKNRMLFISLNIVAGILFAYFGFLT